MSQTPSSRLVTAGSLGLLASPILLLIGAAIAALVVSASPAQIWAQLRDEPVRDAIFLSLRTTFVSLAVITVSGTAVALLLHRSRGIMRGALELLVTLPTVMPPSVAGIALLLGFGRLGLLGSVLSHFGITVAFTPLAVVMAQTFVAAPFYIREAATAFQVVDPSIVDAAKLDGAGQASMFRYITAPVVAPFMITGAVLAWARALGEFGATILFAGSLQGVTQTLPLAIYLGFESNFDQAKAMAIVLLIVAAVVLTVTRFALRRRLVYAH